MSTSTLLKNAFQSNNLGSIFQKSYFFNLHSEGRGHFYEWEVDGVILASLHLTPVSEGHWKSPSKGTFAGLAFENNIRIDELMKFVDFIEADLKSLNAKSLEILPAPMAHDSINFANQIYVLHASGYHISQYDLNQSMEVDDICITKKMSYGNQKRLRKCEREGLSVEQVLISSLPRVYETLESNRFSKGLLMSMSLAQLKLMADTFPDSMVLFGVRDQKNIDAPFVAAALCLRLTPSILYVFYWGDLPGYTNLSPIVMIAKAIYDYCRAQGIKLLDVGTSTLGSVPNHGLLQFKRGLGFTESLKIRMRKFL